MCYARINERVNQYLDLLCKFVVNRDRAQLDIEGAHRRRVGFATDRVQEHLFVDDILQRLVQRNRQCADGGELTCAPSPAHDRQLENIEITLIIIAQLEGKTRPVSAHLTERWWQYWIAKENAVAELIKSAGPMPAKLLDDDGLSIELGEPAARRLATLEELIGPPLGLAALAVKLPAAAAAA